MSSALLVLISGCVRNITNEEHLELCGYVRNHQESDFKDRCKELKVTNDDMLWEIADKFWETAQDHWKPRSTPAW